MEHLDTLKPSFSPKVGLVSSGTLKSSTFWLGGLFTPEAFITATRQCVAQVSSHLDWV